MSVADVFHEASGAILEGIFGRMLSTPQNIYTWLTQPALDPTNSGRVTMDYLMKLVTMALEWSYEASETNVRSETLEKAAELLVLRRDTLRIIDGEGPEVKDSPEKPTQTLPEHTQTGDLTPSVVQEPATTGSDTVEDRKQSAKPPKCTFSRVVVPIELKRFLESGIALVECPNCASTRTLEPHGGVLRFKSHDKRKTNVPNTGQRWAKGETDWDVIGG